MGRKEGRDQGSDEGHGDGQVCGDSKMSCSEHERNDDIARYTAWRGLGGGMRPPEQANDELCLGHMELRCVRGSR